MVLGLGDSGNWRDHGLLGTIIVTCGLIVGGINYNCTIWRHLEPPTQTTCTCTLVQGTFHQNWQGENSPFLLHFLIHIHVFMFCKKSELILFKIDFLQIFKVAPKSGQTPCTIVQGCWQNFIKNVKVRILHFYNFF